MGVIERWRRHRRRRRQAAQLYGEVVALAREPRLYATFGVPDDLDGRFEMLALHLVAVAHGLRRAGEMELAQELVELFFTDLDRNLREMGVGDLSVGKHVKRLGQLFLARSRALTEALEHGREATVVALIARNLPSVPPDHGRALTRRLFALAERYAGSSPSRNVTTGAI